MKVIKPLTFFDEIKIIHIRNVNSSKRKNKEFELRNRPNQSWHLEERKRWELGMHLVYG